MDANKSKKILIELEQGYDLIADKFSGTRAFMWRDLEFMKHEVNPDDKVLDFGCGNGRLAGFLENNYQEFTGVDISQRLIDIAKQRYHSEKTEFIKVSPISKRSDRATKEECGRTSFALPFKDDYFDVVFSIAVFHHLPGKEYRQKIAKELYRVLRPEGKLIISVWNIWQRRFWKYHFKAVKNKISGKSTLGWGDLHIPFKAKEKVFQRYHHAFRKKELKKLLTRSGFKVLDCKKDFNIICVASKS